MVQPATVYRILLVSTSNLIDERKAISGVVHAWNAANLYCRGAYLDLIILEKQDTHEKVGEPRTKADEQLVENYDFMIGVFWARLNGSTVKAESDTMGKIRKF